MISGGGGGFKVRAAENRGDKRFTDPIFLGGPNEELRKIKKEGS